MLSGTVSDYDAAQPSMQTVLAREADTSIDAVYLTLTAGSVIVEAELYFGTAAGATFAASQLLAGIFASSAALETALNIQFEEDLVGVTASVQQILVAPEYDAAEASLVGIGVGVGVGAVLLVVVVGGVVLHRIRRKTPTAAQASVTVPQNIQPGMTFHARVPLPTPAALPPRAAAADAGGREAVAAEGVQVQVVPPAPAAAPQPMTITVPDGVAPGQPFLLNTPHGQMQVLCPPGRPGRAAHDHQRPHPGGARGG